jgi:hypothetical protein
MSRRSVTLLKVSAHGYRNQELQFKFQNSRNLKNDDRFNSKSRPLTIETATLYGSAGLTKFRELEYHIYRASSVEIQHHLDIIAYLQ